MNQEIPNSEIRKKSGLFIDTKFLSAAASAHNATMNANEMQQSSSLFHNEANALLCLQGDHQVNGTVNGTPNNLQQGAQPSANLQGIMQETSPNLFFSTPESTMNYTQLFHCPTGDLYKMCCASDYFCRVTAKITAKLDRGFFLCDSEWTSYRRNYFQVSVAYSLANAASGQLIDSGVNDGPLIFALSNGAMIHHFEVGMMGRIQDTDKTVELIQHTPKRDKNSSVNLPSVSIRSGGNPFNWSPTTSIGYSRHANSDIATFERVQFKKSTANNGKKKAAQQFYCLSIELYAVTESNERHIIALLPSAPLVIRGRSPGHYSKSKAQHKDGSFSLHQSLDFDTPPSSADTSFTDSPFPTLSPPLRRPFERFSPYGYGPSSAHADNMSNNSGWLRSAAGSASDLNLSGPTFTLPSVNDFPAVDFKREVTSATELRFNQFSVPNQAPQHTVFSPILTSSSNPNDSFLSSRNTQEAAALGLSSANTGQDQLMNMGNSFIHRDFVLTSSFSANQGGGGAAAGGYYQKNQNYNYEPTPPLSSQHQNREFFFSPVKDQ